MSDQQPMEVEVVANQTYYWCRCGKSKTQPFCDGSHQGTDIEPLAFTPSESKTVWLCVCKKTQDAPYCDGSHNK